MAGVVGDINPKTMESAKRQFVELYGSALVMNTYLKIALVLVSLVALGLLGLNFHTAARYSQVKPLVVRIDEVGRAEAVVYDASRYQPQPPELRYFLTQFVVKHFSRIRSTLQREYPDSLFFLNPALADATIAQNDQSRVLEMFVTNPTADEIEVSVQNVSLSELGTLPFKAAVTFQKVYYTPDAVRKEPRNLRRAGRLRPARARAKRVRPCKSVGPPGRIFPRRSSVRGWASMIANAAFLAALSVFLFAGWLAGELRFLAPYKTVLFHEHAALIGGAALILFLNLTATYYSVARWLFLRDTGRKLLHLDRQLATDDAVLDDLRSYLK